VTHNKKAGNADDGRLADPVLPGDVDAPVVRPSETSSCGFALSVTTLFGMIGFADDYTKLAKRDKRGVSGSLRIVLEFAVVGWGHGATSTTRSSCPTMCGCTSSCHSPLLRAGPCSCPRGCMRPSGRSSWSHRQRGQPDRRPRRPGDRSLDHERRHVPDLRLHRRRVDGRSSRTTVTRVTIAQYPPRRPHLRRRGGRRVRRRAVRRRRRFLWYNAYPAQVFMGDVGALLESAARSA